MAKKEKKKKSKEKKPSLVKKTTLSGMQKVIQEFDKKIAELKEKRSEALRLYKQIRKEGG